MAVIVDPMLINSPPHWGICDAALKKFVPLPQIGYPCSPGELNRFRNRYRVAKSFGSLTLETYTQDTVEGYTALFKIFLTYTAFEQYLRCLDLKLKATEPLIAHFAPAACLAELRSVVQGEQFLQVVRQHLDGKDNEFQFGEYLSGRSCNPLYLASGVRHIFAHGILAPNAGAGYAQPAILTCKILTAFLFKVMDGDMEARLAAHGFI